MTKPLQFTILWPDKRTVSARQITTWYGDEKANGKIDKRDISRTASDKALALHQAGSITLSSDKP